MRLGLLVAAACAVWTRGAGGCEVANTCVTDLTQSDCAQGQYLIQNSHIFGCCPRCEARAGLGEFCFAVPCAPGLECQGVLCIQGTVTPAPDPDEGGCVPPASGSYPSCLADGRYAPVQCKGDDFTGRCFCTDESGRRIFGQMWRDEAADMTCACSRRRAELEASGRGDVSLHCTTSGNYEPLQCDDGLCWCAEPATGQPTSLPLSELNMNLLPCYSSAVTGSQYLRRCESVVHALGRIHREQSEHGTNFFGNPVTFCDYDGTYGAFQVTNGQFSKLQKFFRRVREKRAYCTGRGGTILGAWQATFGAETANMNCNCARDTMLHFPARGMSVSQVCLGNGNYRAYQTSGDLHYCVDADGYPVTDYMDMSLPALC